MDFKALQKKYQQLLIENNRLKEEIKKLKAQFGLTAGREESQDSDTVSGYLSAPEPELLNQQGEPKLSIAAEGINKRSGTGEKVRLFMSLFRGRDDVYAKRWENKTKGTAGYSPACGNEWKPSICQKPKIKCSVCKHQDFLSLNEAAVDAHLRGHQNLVAGIYPLLPNETCWFLAIDFDDEGWQKDVTALFYVVAAQLVHQYVF